MIRIEYAVLFAVFLHINLAYGSPIDSKNVTVDVTKSVPPTQVAPARSSVVPPVPIGEHVEPKHDVQPSIAVVPTENVTKATNNSDVTTKMPVINSTIRTNTTAKTANVTVSPGEAVSTGNGTEPTTVVNVTPSNNETAKVETTTPMTAQSTKATSTVAPSKSSTTESAHTTLPTAKSEVVQKDRDFDGPSFIGGIVLALGLTGIGFVAYKFCKARANSNYRNL